MEDNKIVLIQKLKSLNGEVENLITSDNIVENIENYETYDLKLKNRITNFEVDKDTFATKVDNQDGTYLFKYDEENEVWKTEEENPQEVDLSEYGITFDGESFDNDLIYIAFYDGKLENIGYGQYNLIFRDKETDFISFSSSYPVTIKSNHDNTDDILNTYGKTSFFQLNTEPIFFYKFGLYLEFNDCEVKVVIAKKVEQ